MRAASALSSLFGSGGGADDDDGDPLVYVKPKDPMMAAAKPAAAAKVASKDSGIAPAPSATSAAQSTGSGSSGAQEFIYATSVQALYLYNATTKAYDAKGTGSIGCVIVGAGTSYNLMFYDQAKQTLALAAVTPTLRFELQPGGQGKYVAIASPAGMYSVLCGSASASCDLLRNLTVTAAHVGLHAQAGTLSAGAGAGSEVKCTVEAGAGDAAARAAGPGDTVTARISVHSMTTIPSARPSDVLKSPPVVSSSTCQISMMTEGGATDLRGKGLARLLKGAKAGERRLAIAPLSELMATGDLDPSSMAGSSALSLAGSFSSRGGGVVVMVDAVVVAVVQAPVLAAPIPQYSGGETSGYGGTAGRALPVITPMSSTGATPPSGSSLFTGEADGDADGGYTRSRANSTASTGAGIRERMARLATSGGAPLPPVLSSGPNGGVQVSSGTASLAALERARGASTATEESLQGGVAGHTASHSPATKGPHNSSNNPTNAPINPMTGMPLGAGGAAQVAQAAAQAQAMANMGMGGMGMGGMGMGGMGMLPLMMQAMGGGGIGGQSLGALTMSVDSVAEGVKELRGGAGEASVTLSRVDGKLDRVLAQLKVGALGVGATGGLAGLSASAMALVVHGEEDGDGAGSGDGARPAQPAIPIPDLVRSLTSVLNTAGDMNKRLEERTSKIVELRKSLTSARKEHEEALDSIDRLTSARASLFREATLAKAEKAEADEAAKALGESLVAERARSKAAEAATLAAQLETRKAFGEAADAMGATAEAQASLTAEQRRSADLASQLQNALSRCALLTEALDGEKAARVAASAAAAADLESARTESEMRLQAMSRQSEEELFSLVRRMEEEEASALAAAVSDAQAEGQRAVLEARRGAHKAGYEEGYAAASKQAGLNAEAAAAMAAEAAAVEAAAQAAAEAQAEAEAQAAAEAAREGAYAATAAQLETLALQEAMEQAEILAQDEMQCMNAGKAALAVVVEEDEFAAQAAQVELQAPEVAAEGSPQQAAEAADTAAPVALPALLPVKDRMELALTDLYALVRPEFASRGKAADLLASLGPSIWAKLATKYKPEVVAPYLQQYDLGAELDATDGQYEPLRAALRNMAPMPTLVQAQDLPPPPEEPYPEPEAEQVHDAPDAALAEPLSEPEPAAEAESLPSLFGSITGDIPAWMTSPPPEPPEGQAAGAHSRGQFDSLSGVPSFAGTGIDASGTGSTLGSLFGPPPVMDEEEDDVFSGVGRGGAPDTGVSSSISMFGAPLPVSASGSSASARMSALFGGPVREDEDEDGPAPPPVPDE